MHFQKLIIALALTVSATTSLSALAQSNYSVTASVETKPVPSSGDAADDSAVWVHPVDPSLSTIIGTNKQGGLAVYDLSGKELHYHSDGKMNNVDLRYNFKLGAQSITIVAASNRSSSSIALYKVDPFSRQLVNVAARIIKVGFSDIYGLGMYQSRISGKTYVFVGDKNYGKIEQWELFDNGSGKVDAKKVRSFSVGSQSEGIVADDERGDLYIAEEDVGIWKYGAEPQDGTSRVQVDKVGSNGLKSDVEGLAIYKGANDTGYLIASNQGANRYNIYEREGANKFISSFSIVNGAVDGTNDTDGIEVMSFGMGSLFPNGAFIAQDGSNDNGYQNFKIVPWERIAQNGSIPLMIDNKTDPRGASTTLPEIDPLPPTEPAPRLYQFKASADATVKAGSPSSNYGSASTLEIDGSSPVCESYIKFAVSNVEGKVTRAKLRFYATNGSSDGPDLYSTGSSWSESTINYSNRPARTSGRLEDKGAVAKGSFVEYDVTNVISGNGTFSFNLAETASDGTDFASRSASNPPVLLLETLAGSDTPEPPSEPPTEPPTDPNPLPPKTYQFPSSADATVKAGSQTSNYGSDSKLEIDGSSPVCESYIKFAVSNVEGSVTRAKLRFYVVNGSSDGPNLYSTGSSWSESTINYSNRPARTSGVLEDKGAVSKGSFVEYDVTNVVKGNGTFSFNLAETASDGTDFASRSASNPPVLIVEAQSSSGETDPTTPPAEVDQIQSFTLVNSSTEKDVAVISQGTSFSYSALGTYKLNIRADMPSTFKGKVKFEISGSLSRTYTAPSAFYTLFGYKEGNYYYGSGLKVGSYKLKATPIVLQDGKEVLGTAKLVDFSIVDGSVSEPDPNPDPPTVPGDMAFTSIGSTAQVINGQSYSVQSALKDWSIQKTSNGGVYRFEVREGENRANGGDPDSRERSELKHQTDYAMGTEVWISYSFMIEKGTLILDEDSNISQWHPGVSASPSLSIQLYREKLRIRTIKGSMSNQIKDYPYISTNNLERGRWYSLVHRVKFNAYGQAYLQMWLDGQKIIDLSNVSIGLTDSVRTYWKFGLYRDRNPITLSTRYANMEVSRSSLLNRVSSPLPIAP